MENPIWDSATHFSSLKPWYQCWALRVIMTIRLLGSPTTFAFVEFPAFSYSSCCAAYITTFEIGIGYSPTIVWLDSTPDKRFKTKATKWRVHQYNLVYWRLVYLYPLMSYSNFAWYFCRANPSNPDILLHIGFSICSRQSTFLLKDRSSLLLNVCQMAVS